MANASCFISGSRLIRFELGCPARAVLHIVQMLFSLPWGQGLHFAQLFFTLPWGQGLQSLHRCFGLPCGHRFFPIVGARRHPLRTRFCAHRKRRGRCRGFDAVSSRPVEIADKNMVLFSRNVKRVVSRT